MKAKSSLYFLIAMGVSLLYPWMIFFVHFKDKNWTEIYQVETQGNLVSTKVPQIQNENKRNKYNETDLDVQTRIADATDLSDSWNRLTGLSALILSFASIIFGIRQWATARKWDVGSFEIGFDDNAVQHIARNDNAHFFRVNAKAMYSGKSMARLISTKFVVEPFDFMLLGKNWWQKLGVDEIYNHKMVRSDTDIPITFDSKDYQDINEVKKLKKPVENRVEVGSPLCLRGVVKYNDSLGQTWIKPFIFRFAWNDSNNVFVLPWHNHCTPVKKYPTNRTRIYQFGERHPFLFKYAFWLSEMFRD